MTEEIIENYRTDTIEAFRNYKKLAERAIGQIAEDEYFRAIDEESNSIATIVKHIGGNLRSRWTDFLTADGEKSDRDRDAEFVSDADTREGPGRGEQGSGPKPDAGTDSIPAAAALGW